MAALLSRAENGEELQAPAFPAADVRVVGVTGSAGAGKSTLLAALIGHLRRRGSTVAVLACDPQSPVTGGALLGDRIRVKFDPQDEGVFFRSLSTRGAPGGISRAVGPAVHLLGGFGFDVVLVETVGIGQDQVDARHVVDTLVLLLTPNTGDQVQWEKAGVLEVADIIVVNKADLPGADRLRQQVTDCSSLGHGPTVPVLEVVATTGQGVEELWRAIEKPAAR